MKVILLGCRYLDFTANDGKVIKGCQLFVAHDKNPDDPTWYGSVVEKVWLQPDCAMYNALKNIQYGKMYELVYEQTSLKKSELVDIKEVGKTA